MKRALSLPADLALAMRTLPPFHDGRWRRAISHLDPAMGLFSFARAGIDIIRCHRRGWLEYDRGDGPDRQRFSRITRLGRAQLSIATALREDLAAAVQDHRGTIELVPDHERPERRGFGIGSAVGCGLVLAMSVYVIATTDSPTSFLTASVVMCGAVALLTDYFVGDFTGEVD